jgi:hypothetical protein
MYAAGHGSAMAITRAFAQLAAPMHVIASWPSAYPGHSKVKPGAA